jgi:hypothetical protein
MKATVSGVCLKVIDQLHPQPVHLSVLLKACQQAGLDVVEAQVYAGVQSLASTGKCGRGAEKRTYCRVEENVEREAREPRGPATERTRRVKQGLQYHPPAPILEGIEEWLGPRVPKPLNKSFWAVLLDGTWDLQFIRNRAMQVCKGTPSAWCTYSQGDLYVVGFLP